MEFVYGFAAGASIGIFGGGYLAYKYADKLVAKAVAEYRKAQALERHFAQVAGNVIGAVKKEL